MYFMYFQLYIFVEHNQLKMGKEMTDIAGNISALTHRAQTMTEVLKNVTNEIKQQRRDTTGDMDRLEMKYLEQCTMLPLQVNIEDCV